MNSRVQNTTRKSSQHLNKLKQTMLSEVRVQDNSGSGSSRSIGKSVANSANTVGSTTRMAEFDLVAREYESTHRRPNYGCLTNINDVHRSSPKKTTTVESTTTMETMATPHRSSYKTVLDQRNHSPISNSSCSSPPAPAQVPNMTSSTGLTFNIGSFANIRQSISPSKPLSSFPENDQFLSNVKSGERREQSRSPIVTTATTTTTTTSTVTMTTLTTTTNGWSKEANHSSTIHGKKGVPEHDALSGNQSSHSTSPMPIGNEPLAQLLITLKDQNKSLIREIEDLRIKLEDAEGDLKLVRCQMRSMSKHMDSVVIETNRDRMVDETILGELEFYKGKVLLLERDIQSLLDEKEELVMTRDDLTLKNERLNEHLITLMRNLSGQGGNYSDSGSLSYDVDALYLENRYLKEKIKNEEEERHLLVERLTKYKELMDQHQRNEGQRLSPSKKHYATNNTPVDLTNPTTLATLQLPGGRVVNARDVERLINSDSINSMEVSKSNQMYLWSLLVALFEGMQTKNMNLVHARKTNRLLGKRVEELESHLHNYELDGRNSGKGPSLKMSESDRIDSSSARSTPSTISVSRHNDPLDGTDGNLSSATAKETSEDENDELSSTAISTPSTTRHSMSIERHLKALQNEVLADQVPSPTKLDYASLHLNHRSGTSHRYRDFDSRKPSPATSLFH